MNPSSITDDGVGIARMRKRTNLPHILQISLKILLCGAKRPLESLVEILRDLVEAAVTSGRPEGISTGCKQSLDKLITHSSIELLQQPVSRTKFLNAVKIATRKTATKFQQTADLLHSPVRCLAVSRHNPQNTEGITRPIESLYK